MSGRVQGVFYRASTLAQAQSLGVTGHARNLADGRVEVLACGPAEAVAALCRWLWQGSPASSVSAVEMADVAVTSIEPWPQVFSTT